MCCVLSIVAIRIVVILLVDSVVLVYHLFTTEMIIIVVNNFNWSTIIISMINIDINN